MARLITAGAEFNDRTLEGYAAGGSFGIATDQVRTGARSFKGSSSIDTGTWSFTGATSRSYYLRFAFRCSQLVNDVVADLWTGGSESGARLRLSSIGSFSLTPLSGGAGSSLGSLSAVISTNAWYVLELALFIGTGATDTIEARLDGSSFASASAQSLTDGAPNQAVLYGPDGGSFWFDDVALNDSTGSEQMTWPGDGRVALLLPTATSSAGSWRNGTGGTTNLWDAVDNTPPSGVASANETATTNIENAVSSATLPNYDATMTTYSAAGVGASDTVNLVQPVIVHGEDVSTGTKTGNVSVVSNPAIGTSTFTAGNDAGAHGVYPSLWTVTRGTISYAPSVTPGTAPVMRAAKTDTGSRALCVCFMGMLVDYTPSAVVSDRPSSRIIHSHAVHHASTW